MVEIGIWAGICGLSELVDSLAFRVSIEVTGVTPISQTLYVTLSLLLHPLMSFLCSVNNKIQNKTGENGKKGKGKGHLKTHTVTYYCSRFLKCAHILREYKWSHQIIESNYVTRYMPPSKASTDRNKEHFTELLATGVNRQKKKTVYFFFAIWGLESIAEDRPY